MKVEIRKDSIVVEGYVNAVDRFSRPFFHQVLGKIVEKVMPNAFKKAIAKSQNINVLLNHNESRKLASTSEGTAKLYEDNVGLKAVVTITDPEVVEKGRRGKLRGWSFGFTSIDEETRAGENGVTERTLKEFNLPEVSIIDDTNLPAYIGTSIEARSIGGETLEIRTGEDTEIDTTQHIDTTPPDSSNDDDEVDEEAQKAELAEQRRYREKAIREASI